jgi:anti-anti-sigma factor
VKVGVQAHGNVMVLVANGPLVHDDLIDLRRTIEQQHASGSGKVIVDCAEVPYLDSTGIEFLLEFASIARPPHVRTRLAGLTETCREALELTDILPRLETFDTVENALRAWQR